MLQLCTITSRTNTFLYHRVSQWHVPPWGCSTSAVFQGWPAPRNPSPWWRPACGSHCPWGTGPPSTHSTWSTTTDTTGHKSVIHSTWSTATQISHFTVIYLHLLFLKKIIYNLYKVYQNRYPKINVVTKYNTSLRSIIVKIKFWHSFVTCEKNVHAALI